MNKAETALLLQYLIAVFPGAKMTADELTITIWQDLLSDFSKDLVMCATKKLCMEKPFLPAPADVREAAAQILSASDSRPGGAEAWAKVRRAISDYGFYRPDQARAALGEEIWRAVEMVGGWSEICVSDAGSGVISAQFIKRYEEARGRDIKRLQIPDQLREEMKRLAGEALLLPGAGES